MIEFKMPSLGADMDEGTLQEWLVKPGDAVRRGQVVAVVDTTKAAVEVECWHDGTIQELLIPAGETVGVGTVLATLSDHGGSPKSFTSTPTRSRAVAPRERSPSTMSNKRRHHSRNRSPRREHQIGQRRCANPSQPQ